MSAHVTDRQIAAFLDGTLQPSEVVALDLHLSACGECRARATAAGRDGAARLAAALATDADGGLHPDDEEMAEYVDGKLPATGHLERHLADCGACAATIADLRELRKTIAARRRTVVPIWPLAAAAVLVIGLSLWMWPRLQRSPRTPAPAPVTASHEQRIQDGRSTIVLNDGGVTSGLDRLSTNERATIAAALASGRLPEARNLDRVRREAGRLMGSGTTGAAFGPASPVATAVDNAQPRFRWTPHEGAHGYVVTIVDETLKTVAESPRVTNTEWRPQTALPRGRVYVWQVRALLGSRSLTAPAPPASEARFYVLDDREAAEVASLRDRAGDSRVAAVLLAQHGLMDDAEAGLVRAAAENPSVATLPRLAEAATNARTQAPADRR